MKAVLLFSLLALVLTSLAACGPDAGTDERAAAALGQVPPAASDPSPTAAPPTAAPTGTSEPGDARAYRSYPAPTGAAGFRRYYQIRCYPGCHTGATPAVPGEAVAQVAEERPHRSYPAPTGVAGFRRYYQIRCYPGCHSYSSATPAATRVHP